MAGNPNQWLLVFILNLLVARYSCIYYVNWQEVVIIVTVMPGLLAWNESGKLAHPLLQEEGHGIVFSASAFEGYVVPVTLIR